METLSIGSSGPAVELLQSALNRASGANLAVDGRFGQLTREAVETFQRGSGLRTDGVASGGTWAALRPHMDGYDTYSVSAGDTLYSIASRFGSSVNAVLAANPDSDVYNLKPGQRVIVPSGDVVFTDISYTSEVLRMNLRALKTVYPFLETGEIGKSSLCAGVPYIRLGRGAREVFYNASFHANEWITTPVLMKFIENYARAYVEGATIYGYPARTVFDNVSIYIVPMVNPDGVDLVTGAIKPGSQVYQSAEAIALKFPHLPFPDGWKANILGTDLNLQFPANWEQAREIKFAQGFTGPAPRDFVGTAPLSAVESANVSRFTLEHDFSLTLSYHTQGRVIFWQYLDYLPENSLYIGSRFAQSSGYSLEQTPYASSFAGYKDWFIQHYDRPGYTIEAGLGVNPLPISQFDTIYAENEGILVLGAVLAP